MLTTKLVVRILDADAQLLGWTEVAGEARGDGCLWSSRSYHVGVERAGQPASVSVHWADVNVEARTPITHAAVVVGEVITLPWANTPVMTIGPMPGPLPPVTVRGAVSIGVPVGQLGSAAQ
jgi:hypothetical protein